MFAGAAVLLVVFTLIERRLGEAAMLDLLLFRNVTFIGISVTTLLANAAGMSAIFLQVSYMQNVLGFSPLATGVRFLPLTLTLFVAAAVTGSLTVKVPLRVLIGIGTGLIAAGLLLITLVHPSSSWTAMLPSMLLTGLGMGMFNPPRSSLAIGVAEPAKAGMAAGIGETFQQVGIAIGIAGFGALFQHRVTDAFATSPAGAQLGAQAHQAGKAVAAGAGNQLSTTVPAALAGAVRSAAREAFVHGLTDVLVVGGAVAAVGAVVGFLFIRTRDLHESALAGAEGGGH